MLRVTPLRALCGQLFLRPNARYQILQQMRVLQTFRSPEPNGRDGTPRGMEVQARTQFMFTWVINKAVQRAHTIRGVTYRHVLLRYVTVYKLTCGAVHCIGVCVSGGSLVSQLDVRRICANQVLNNSLTIEDSWPCCVSFVKAKWL